MAGRPIRTFTVLPHLPERLQALHRLAYNMWWSWNQDAAALFHRIDEDLFEKVENSPIKLLSAIEQVRLEELLRDEGFLAHMDRVDEALRRYMEGPTWYGETFRSQTPYRIAYFSAEFGIHESIPVYSGGLGVLAGDHLKSASDLGVPLMGVGLMYREGYFRQYLNADGWQQERYPENDFFNLPLIAESRPDGRPLHISVPFPGREVHARVWRIQVGRVPLYLLDANIPENSPEDRNITAQLYGGDNDTRIRQEMILGIGGIRALRALGKLPTVCHLNEGHSAFCALERIRGLMEEQQLDFGSAREAVAAGTCFTTHTPVPAGNDIFAPHLVEHYLSPLLQQLRIDRGELLGLGRQNPRDPNEPFCMTVLAIRLANVTNAVSKLHANVSRRMWKGLWPNLPEAEVPISEVTNGVHTRSWLATEMSQLFDRYLGVQWQERPSDHSIWKRVDLIPNAELWRTHERRRERLVAFARARLKFQLRRRGAPPAEVARADEALDPDALTIGFARRFATYKRGTLIFRNTERLAAIVNDKDRPVQFVFAGKAHPRDHGGKELIAEILHMARRPEFRRRIMFLEDYDVNVARLLVQGVDVWLNNPRRPLEASGTSGMKVCGNGGINLSVLDGWWVEGYRQENGWAIGAGEEYTDLPYQDDVVGYSMGAMIACKLLAEHPDRLFTVTLGGAGGMYEGADTRFFHRLADDLDHGRGIGALLTVLTPPGRTLDPERIRMANKVLPLFFDAKALAAVVRGWDELAVKDTQLRNNKLPVLGIVGEDDPLKQNVEQVQKRLAHMEIVTIPDADHMNAFVRPQFVRAIKKFLGEHPARPKTERPLATVPPH